MSDALHQEFGLAQDGAVGYASKTVLDRLCCLFCLMMNKVHGQKSTKYIHARGLSEYCYFNEAGRIFLTGSSFPRQKTASQRKSIY